MPHSSREPANAGDTPPGMQQEDKLQGLSRWERERIRSRAFALWRDAGFPHTQRRDHWGLAQLQVLKNDPAAGIS
ncbi:DUF2934 domain-containing protein [Xanthobacter sp. TB0136]|uniref:DUF2934 domain-containing protein n=1 Tax=Xanthobacter sp. TB0136 TaxID=3459177 RepID=UPI00403A5406